MSIDLKSLPDQQDYNVTTGDKHTEIRDPLQITLNGSAMSVVDATWTLIVASEPGGTPELDKSVTAQYTASGIREDTPADGEFTLIITESDIATLAASSDIWYYSIHLKLPSDHASLPDWDGHIRQGVITISDVA